MRAVTDNDDDDTSDPRKPTEDSNKVDITNTKITEEEEEPNKTPQHETPLSNATTTTSTTPQCQSNSTTTTTTDDDDETLLTKSTKLLSNEQILAAGRLLNQIQNKSLLTPSHHQTLQRAHTIESSLTDLRTTPDQNNSQSNTTSSSSSSSQWTCHGKTPGSFHKSKDGTNNTTLLQTGLFLPSVVYYKVAESTLSVRVETPVAQSLLLPLLSVLNETDLFTEWLPSWKTPVRLGFRSVENLKRTGRASRCLRIVTDTPWPLAPRELFLDVMAIDDIDHNGFCAVKLSSLPPDAHTNDPNIPSPNPDYTAVVFDGVFLFEACPPDHVSLESTTEEERRGVFGKDEELLLVTFKMCTNPNIPVIPQNLINFVVGTVVGRMWEKFLQIAENVKSGKMPKHKSAIENNPEFYKWMEGRIQKMLENLKER